MIHLGLSSRFHLIASANSLVLDEDAQR